MTRLTDDQLKAASAAADWNTLWLEADPWIKFTMSELNCGDDDAYQEAQLATGKAVRTWDPQIASFGTHIVNQVRGALLNWINGQNNAGVGSRWQAAEAMPVEVISLNDPADAPGTVEEDDDVPATHLDRLTYEALDDSTEFEKALLTLEPTEEIKRALTFLPTDESKFFREVMNAGGTRAFHRATGMPQKTVSDHMVRITQKLSAQQQKSCYIRNTGLGRSVSEQSLNGRHYITAPTGNPWADWSYHPTAADLAAGSAPRDGNYPWSAKGRALMGLRPRKDET